MTEPYDPDRPGRRRVPASYEAERRANYRWISVLRAAVARGLSDADAIAQANDAVPEALLPSRHPSGDWRRRVRHPIGPEPEAEPTPEAPAESEVEQPEPSDPPRP